MTLQSNIISPEQARSRNIPIMRGRASRTNLVANLSLAILAIMAISSSATSIKLQRSSYTIWRELVHPVDLGLYLYDVEYAYINPCNGIGAGIDNRTHSIPPKAYNQMRNKCKNLYNDSWVAQMEQLLLCVLPNNEKFEEETQSKTSRVKRMIVFLGIVVFLLIVSAIGVVSNHFFNPNSGHNVLQSLQERKTTLKKELDTMKMAFNETVQNQTSNHEALEKLANMSNENKQSIVELSAIVPHIPWESDELNYKIQTATSYLRSLTRGCNERQVLIEDFAELVGKSAKENLQQFIRNDTSFTSVTRPQITALTSSSAQ